MKPRIFLHVGSPKTGTTFLQQVLWSQRPVARKQGLLLPMRSFDDHYLATLDVRGLAGKSNHPARAAGMWRRMVEQSLDWSGNVLISHELFAGASQEQARQAMAAFPDDAEVHVVLTARDLVRQIPAEWQEHVKHRSTETFPAFVKGLRRENPDAWFWKVQDYPSVLSRWGGHLPPERLHVVTVPPAGTDPSLLWARFAGLLDLDPSAFELGGSRSNTSLGYEQAELLRRVNAELGDRLPIPGPYPADVKTVFAQRVLAERRGTKFGLQGDDLDYARERGARMAEELKALGAHVVGDLADLVPPVTEEEPVDLQALVSDDKLLAESIAALAGLLDEHRARRTERDALRRRVAHAGHIVPAKTQVKQKLVGASERWPVLMGPRKAYVRTRDAVRSRRRG
ncbi:MAG TPA: hypothetical protein VLA97_10005 [Nocardioidaceae bacterium]|nr:hypothetical protein [Nocardioidaceae bacterium]